MQACFDVGMRQPSKSRKLLIASVGVATINYVAACGHESVTSGNLVAPLPNHAGAPASVEDAAVLSVAGTGGSSGNGGAAAIPPTSGNLVAPPTLPPRPMDTPPTSGNLMPPPTPPPTGGVKPPVKGH